ncbi:hypothetical protein AAG906_003701 [Vitis piasezkii]
MLNLAEQWGWIGNDTKTHLGKLLKQMIDESDPKLPFGYIKLDERSHIASNAIKTNRPMASPLGLQRNFSNVERFETKMDILLPRAFRESCI